MVFWRVASGFLRVLYLCYIFGLCTNTKYSLLQGLLDIILRIENVVYDFCFSIDNLISHFM